MFRGRVKGVITPSEGQPKICRKKLFCAVGDQNTKLLASSKDEIAFLFIYLVRRRVLPEKQRRTEGGKSPTSSLRKQNIYIYFL